MKPNLFIVGAMKSGTTTLHDYLGAHPDIFMSSPKEPAYFARAQPSAAETEQYLALFDKGRGVAYRGESSTDYTKLPRYQGVAERIFDFAPDAKIIYIMRDPVERSISHYWWEVQWSAEGRDMVTAAKKVNDITDVSYYSMQLGPYIERFGREQVYTLTLEALSAEPLAALREIFAWLNVDTAFSPPGIGRRSNASSRSYVRKVRGSALFSHLRGSPPWELLKKILPAPTRAALIRALSKSAEKDEGLREQAIAYLRPIQQRQTEELSKLIGNDFSAWKTLYGNER